MSFNKYNELHNKLALYEKVDDNILRKEEL